MNEQAVQTHLGILQASIQRMATNSAAAKSWCVTIVSAILVLVIDKGRPNFVWLATGPIFLFCFLDAYYLGLEQGFRDSYNEFVNRLHTKQAKPEDLYVISSGDKKGIWTGLFSISVLPFYILLLAMTTVAYIGLRY
jgi:hypothetical protein